MTNPSRKHRNRIVPRCIVFAIFVPTFSPMGVMDNSAPSVKNIIPTMSSTAPNKNRSRMLGGMGAMVKLKSSTIPMIGATAFKASFNLSENLVW